MTIACFIRYEIDPFQKEAFRQYAVAWSKQFILSEERRFTEVVPEAFQQAAAGVVE